MNYSISGSVSGAPYLKCSNYLCNFTYDVEHASHDETVKKLDDWIIEHLDEIYELH